MRAFLKDLWVGLAPLERAVCVVIGCGFSAIVLLMLVLLVEILALGCTK